MEYVPRLQEKRLQAHLRQFPVVCLTGPRQAGKSTLLKHIQRPGWEYINFDQRAPLETALRDPDLFARDLKTPAIIDEAQKAPPIFHSIKAEVDLHPQKRFILSGSANFHLMKNITETLAGRAGILELLPFSVGEMEKIQNPIFFSALLKSHDFGKFQAELREIKIRPLKNIYDSILWGGMPKIQEYRSAEEKTDWFENYRTTYIERDLRNLAQVGDLEDFQKFYQSIAFQTGNKLNLSHLAQEIGITVPTSKRYLTILRTSYQAFTLPPYHINIKKRLVKTPKVYLLDTGLASFFLRYESEEMLRASGRLGALFETWFLNEAQKISRTLAAPPALFFWQTHSGHEIDLLLEAGESLYPMEIKHAARIQEADVKGIEGFMKEIKKKEIPFGIIWYRGDRIQTVGPRVLALPLEYLWH